MTDSMSGIKPISPTVPVKPAQPANRARKPGGERSRQREPGDTSRDSDERDADDQTSIDDHV